MTARRWRRFWETTSPAGRWAVAASIFMLTVTFVPFMVIAITTSISLHVSPVQVIFGPMPGNPLIMWLYYFLPAAAVEVGVALALRHAAVRMQIAGIVGACALATVALIWLGMLAFILVRWLVSGTLVGDYLDMLGMAFFGVPFLSIVVVLNVRAALLGSRDLLGPHPTVLAH